MDTVVKNVRKSAKEKSFLPDEIITNILIRLPVKSVIRCELVCRGWGDIISAHDFVDLYLKSSIPFLLVKTSKNLSLLDIFALDKWWEYARTRLTIHRFPFDHGNFPPSCYILFSHAGLIALKGCTHPEQEFYILNPARSSRECVKITLCEEIRRSQLCAVYYHPSLKEYCSIWKIDETGPLYYRAKPFQPKPIQYKLLNLGSNPSLKMIRNPFNYKVRDENANPLFINNYFYWMLTSGQEYEYRGRNDILEFDIRSEEFMVIPCPVPLNTECMSHQTHLLNSDGVLSFVLILPNTITIWRLEDHEEHLWTSSEYRVSIEICHSYQSVSIIAVVDGILAFQYCSRLFICNLREGTVKNYPKRKYRCEVSFFSYQMSLASLKNCKSALYINKDGEVLV